MMDINYEEVSILQLGEYIVNYIEYWANKSGLTVGKVYEILDTYLKITLNQKGMLNLLDMLSLNQLTKGSLIINDGDENIF